MCGSDDTHPFPVRNFPYRTGQTRADEVQKGDRVHGISDCSVEFSSNKRTVGHPVVLCAKKCYQ